jgi:hypothetical protein
VNAVLEKVVKRIQAVENELGLARMATDMQTIVAAERELKNLQLLQTLLNGFKQGELRTMRMELNIVHLVS